MFVAYTIRRNKYFASGPHSTREEAARELFGMLPKLLKCTTKLVATGGDVQWHHREDVVEIEHKQELVEQQPAPALRPYQQQVFDALKASCEPVADAVIEQQHARRFDRATAFLARFMAHGQSVHRDHIRFFLDLISTMSDDDFAELDQHRRYLRGDDR